MYIPKYYTKKIYNGVTHSNKICLNCVEFTAGVSACTTVGVQIRVV